MSIPQTSKVALVTGAAGGIGHATARALAQAGALVVFADVREGAARAHAGEFGGEAIGLDVSDEASWAEAVAGIEGRHGRLDVLVNSAGIFEVAAIAATSADLYRRIVEINQFGVFLGMRACAPLLARGGGGAIVNISSVAGMIGQPGTIAYAASKWAVRGMTKVAAAEFAALGIRVNSVHPGGIDTDMTRHLRGDSQALGPRRHVPMGRIGQADEVARLVLFLAGEDSSYCTGAEFVCDGGMSAS